jgi:tetratricopeptide (TPR) repeat protein/TolB-like protein
MTPQLWKAAKSLYLEAASAPTGPGPYLSGLRDVDREVIELVRQLLDEDPGLLPDLNRPCWLAEAKPETARALEPGRTLFERFEIIEFLGAGGLGEVYRAFDLRQLIFVALKTLKPALAGDAAAIDMLRNELNTARAVTHPNVCRLHDIHWPVDSDVPPFFTMDLLDGVTLSQYLRKHGAFDTESAWPLVRQMIGGLAAAHASRIVHRDFKSGNVMLTEEGRRAVIMDFGLAREIMPGISLEETLASGNFAGTPAFMAPEQLRGERATFASDIHGFGVCLFEMVTGRLPFEGNSAIEIASRRLSEEAPSPRLFAPKLDRRWEYTILRCLAAEPGMRPASMDAVGEMLAAKPPALWGRRRFVMAAAAAAGVSVAAGGGLLWTAARKRTPVGVELFNIDNRTGDTGLDYVARGMTSELQRRFEPVRGVSVVPMHAVRGSGTVPGKSELAFSGWMSGGSAGTSEFRLDLRLEDRVTGKALWSRTFDQRRFGGLLGMQQAVSKEAAAELQRRVIARSPVLAAIDGWLPAETNDGRNTRNTAAFDYYLRGNSLLQETTPESVHAAVEFFERAVGEDPHFAAALAALAEAHLALLNFEHSYDKALADAARHYAVLAVREDPALAEAHAAMAAVHQIDWDWTASESEYNTALALKPKFARAIRWRAGLVLQFARFDEAIAGFEEAYRIDPYDRAAVSGYSMTLTYAGKLREAVALLEREIGDRDMAPARNNLGMALGLLARRAAGSEAETLYRKAFDQVRIVESIEKRSGAGRSDMSTIMNGTLYSYRGDYQAAAPYLEKLEGEVAARQISPGALAQIYAAQHRLEEAQNALDQAFLLRDHLMYLRVNIFLEELRGQPRFEAMLRTMHLK